MVEPRAQSRAFTPETGLRQRHCGAGASCRWRAGGSCAVSPCLSQWPCVFFFLPQNHFSISLSPETIARSSGNAYVWQFPGLLLGAAPLAAS